MEDNKQYDFYLIGLKHGDDAMYEAKAKADKIEKDYGKEARIQFELGFASSISAYSRLENVEGKSVNESIGRRI